MILHQTSPASTSTRTLLRCQSNSLSLSLHLLFPRALYKCHFYYLMLQPYVAVGIWVNCSLRQFIDELFWQAFCFSARTAITSIPTIRTSILDALDSGCHINGYCCCWCYCRITIAINVLAATLVGFDWLESNWRKFLLSDQKIGKDRRWKWCPRSVSSALLSVLFLLLILVVALTSELLITE